jgi:sec-independent protein translocase protein TatA
MLLENLLQPAHLVLVLAIALLVFGPKNLPQIGKGMGEAIRGFKEAVKAEGPTSEPPRC